MRKKTAVLIAMMIVLGILLSCACTVIFADGSVTGGADTEGPADSVTDGGADGEADNKEDGRLARTVAVLMATAVVIVSVIAAVKKPRE